MILDTLRGRKPFGKIAFAWAIFLWCAGMVLAEPRFAHSRSPFCEGNCRRGLQHVPHRDSDCTCNPLQSRMAAGRNSSKQDYMRHLDEPRKHGGGLLGILAYATVSFAIARLR